MGHVTFPARVAPISAHGLPTLLTISSLLRVDLQVAMLANLLMPPGTDCLYPDVALPLVYVNLILPFYALNPNLFLIKSSRFPTDGANCKDQIWLGP